MTSNDFFPARHRQPRFGLLVQALCLAPVAYLAYRFAWMQDVRTHSTGEEWAWCAVIIISFWVFFYGIRDFGRAHPAVGRAFFDVFSWILGAVIVVAVARSVYKHTRNLFHHDHDHFDEPPSFYRY